MYVDRRRRIIWIAKWGHERRSKKMLKKYGIQRSKRTAEVLTSIASM